MPDWNKYRTRYPIEPMEPRLGGSFTPRQEPLPYLNTVAPSSSAMPQLASTITSAAGAFLGPVGGAMGLAGLMGSFFGSQPEQRSWQDFLDPDVINRLKTYGRDFTDPTSWMNRTLLKQNQEMLAERGGVAARVMEMKQLMGSRGSTGIAYQRQKQMDLDAATKAFGNWQQQLLRNQALGLEATRSEGELGMRARSLAEEYNQEERNTRRSFWDSLTSGMGLLG